jgi:hypothetical protein
MGVEEGKKIATKMLSDALKISGSLGEFSVFAGGELSSHDDCFSIEYDVIYKYGNITRTHALVVGYDPDQYEIPGIEYGENGEIAPITKEYLITLFYYDLALDGLEDKYILF